MNRRHFLASMPVLFAAPSIVRAESLMRISVPSLSLVDLYGAANRIGCDLLIDKAAPGLAVAYAANPEHGPGPFFLSAHARPEWDLVKCLGLGRVSRETMSIVPLRFYAKSNPEIFASLSLALDALTRAPRNHG